MPPKMAILGLALCLLACGRQAFNTPEDDANNPEEVACPVSNNDCGGCEVLDGILGRPCGVCNTGRIACFGKEGTFCEGEDAQAQNNCGGCAELEGQPGSPCGLCGGGQLICEGPEALTCANPDQFINDCGGCNTLRGRPGDVCGACGDGTMVCRDTDTLMCEGASSTNDCGGCAELNGEVGAACGLCDSGRLTCSGDSLVCMGERDPNTLNECGGCSRLLGARSDDCGTCGSGVLFCNGPERLECGGDEGESALNVCGGCRPLEQTPGEACGACGTRVVVCVEQDYARCEGNDEDDPLNVCGGCEPLEGIGEPCGVCGVMACQGEEALACNRQGGPCDLREAILAWHAALLQRTSDRPAAQQAVVLGRALSFAALQSHDAGYFGTMMLQLHEARRHARSAASLDPETDTSTEERTAFTLALGWQSRRLLRFVPEGFDPYLDEARRQLALAITENPERHGFRALATSILWLRAFELPPSVEDSSEAEAAASDLMEALEDFTGHPLVLRAPLYGAEVFTTHLEPMDQLELHTTITDLHGFQNTPEYAHTRFILGLQDLHADLGPSGESGRFDVRMWQLRLEAIATLFAERLFEAFSEDLGRNHRVLVMTQQLLSELPLMPPRSPVTSEDTMLQIACGAGAMHNRLHELDIELPEACCAHLRTYNRLDRSFAVPQICE